MSRTHSADPCGLLARKRVLIVDDDDDSRELLRVVLESRNMDVSDSESATGALTALEHSHFDVLISDIGMPMVDGYALIRSVRKQEKYAYIPAVALTAFARAEDRARALLAGFDMHFGKPCNFADLLQALGTLLAAP
jgi:CheY-like chemotaxis protein